MEQSSERELTFDLHKFSIWLQRMENAMQLDSIDYLPQTIDYSLMPTELLDVIPFENKTSMDFSKFKQESSQQKELMIMSKQFCQSIMTDESKLLILTGKAGVGKTASAVCAAKELTARGKKVVWISEVMVKGWADQAKSIDDLNNCELEIDKLLASNPDVVFLDDDNLAGFIGNLLLEKIYSWFVSNPGKGFFITSNEPIQFKDCYGYKLDGKYYYPPFNDYSSPQYLNWQRKADLAGESLRSKRDGQSIGAIVSDLSWKTNVGHLGQIELIPGFENDKLVAICQAVGQTGSINCSAYDKLRPLQQKWIDVHKVPGLYEYSGDGRSVYIKPFYTANPLEFEKTTCKTIALEMREFNYYGKTIADNSMKQLIRVLNYAHDQGGRRIILINQTSYSREQLLIQIKAQLPKSESERTWSRLMLLLCETEDSIFSYDQFNGHIEVAHPTVKQAAIANESLLSSESEAEIDSALRERVTTSHDYIKPSTINDYMEPWFGAVTPENRDEFVSLYRQEVNANQTRMSRVSHPEEGSESHTISEQAMLREMQQRFNNEFFHQLMLFSVPQLQIERSLFNQLAAFGFTRQILNQWQPPIREFLETSENSTRCMFKRHVETLIFLREHGVTPEQAIVEISSLNSCEAWALALLYSRGLRGEHIRELKNHFSTLYPETMIDEQIGYALQDLIEHQHRSVADAIEEIKRLDGDRMISCFSID